MYSLSYFQLSFICSQKHLGWFKCLLHYDSEEHNLRSIKTRQYHEMILFGACIWLKEDKGELYKVSGRWEILTLVCSRAVLLRGGGWKLDGEQGRKRCSLVSHMLTCRSSLCPVLSVLWCFSLPSPTPRGTSDTACFTRSFLPSPPGFVTVHTSGLEASSWIHGLTSRGLN